MIFTDGSRDYNTRTQGVPRGIGNRDISAVMKIVELRFFYSKTRMAEDEKQFIFELIWMLKCQRFQKYKDKVTISGFFGKIKIKSYFYLPKQLNRFKYKLSVVLWSGEFDKKTEYHGGKIIVIHTVRIRCMCNYIIIAVHTSYAGPPPPLSRSIVNKHTPV